MLSANVEARATLLLCSLNGISIGLFPIDFRQWKGSDVRQIRQRRVTACITATRRRSFRVVQASRYGRVHELAKVGFGAAENR